VTYVLDGVGNAIAVKRGQTMYYLHYNAHGDVVAISTYNSSDDTTNIVARYSYDPWGNPTEYDYTGAVTAIGSFAGSSNQGLFLLFGGMLYDAAAGIYITRTRAYNPRTGRFLERDILDEDAKDGYKGFPFGRDAIGTNLYAWCGNDPVNMVDPSGLEMVPYTAKVPYHYLQWYTGYFYAPVYAIYWLFGYIPVPYISYWKRIAFSYPVVRKGYKMVTRYICVPDRQKKGLFRKNRVSPAPSKSDRSWYSGIVQSIKNNWEVLGYGAGTGFSFVRDPAGTTSQVGKSVWYFGSEFYNAIENEPPSNPAFSNYHHYEANRKSCAEGPAGCLTALALGDMKEAYDQSRRPGDEVASEIDYRVNRAGRIAGLLGQSSPPHLDDSDLDDWLSQ
jgi:RHS repeat-associated protein